jgi:predicted amidohydrolase
MADIRLRIAFLHLAPIPGALAKNRHLIAHAITKAACLGAAWIITPELAVGGYTFADTLGTDWIAPQPDPWMEKVRLFAARKRVAIFLSHPERDPQSGRLYNTVFAIAPDGRPGRITSQDQCAARRVRSLVDSRHGNDGSFRWSHSGTSGMLICADAFSPGIANSLKAKGAQILVSSAAWAPGLHGPNGEWERCTKDTGLPLFVCNRTGADRTLDFRKADSVVAQDGRRLLSMSSERSAIFLIDWDLKAGTLASPEYRQILL